MLDTATLVTFSGALLLVISAIMLLVAAMEPNKSKLLWLISPTISGGLSTLVVFFPNAVPLPVRLDLSAYFILLAHAFAWQAVRSLFGRRPSLLALLVPAAVWFIAFGLVLPDGQPALNVSLQALIFALYNGLAAYEFARVRGEGEKAGRVLFWVFALFGAIALLRIPLVLLLPAPLGAADPQSWSIAAYALLLITQSLFASIYLVSFIKERVADRNRQLAYQDPLTGALNRRAFSDLPIHPAGTRIAVLLCDIDHFKQVNDQFGHDIGDRVIVLVRAAVRQVLGADFAHFYRLGGEEFACLLYSADDMTVMTAAENIRLAYKAVAGSLDDLVINSTLSIGISIAGRDQIGLEQLLKYADRALYQAKGTGRNRVCLYGEPSASPASGPAIAALERLVE